MLSLISASQYPSEEMKQHFSFFLPQIKVTKCFAFYILDVIHGSPIHDANPATATNAGPIL